MSIVKVDEHTLNVLLSELLCERGLKSIGIPRIHRLKHLAPDVLIDIRGIRFLIEGKYPGHRSELISQAQSRLDQGICDGCVMLEYSNLNLGLFPDTLQIKSALESGRFNLGFMSYLERVGLEKWIPNYKPKIQLEFRQVEFPEIVEFLISAHDLLVRTDIISPVIQRIQSHLLEFSEGLLRAGIDIQRIKQILELREPHAEREE